MSKFFLGLLFTAMAIFWYVIAAGGNGPFKIILIIWATLNLIAGIQYFVKFARYIKFGGGVPGVHLSGLPVGEADCVVIPSSESVIIEIQKNRYELPYDKITSADVREKNQLVSASAGDVVAGTLLFGALGTIIASRPKNVREYIMMISCNSEYTNAIAFAIAPKYKKDADKIAAKIRAKMPQYQNFSL